MFWVLFEFYVPLKSTAWHVEIEVLLNGVLFFFLRVLFVWILVGFGHLEDIKASVRNFTNKNTLIYFYYQLVRYKLPGNLSAENGHRLTHIINQLISSGLKFFSALMGNLQDLTSISWEFYGWKSLISSNSTYPFHHFTYNTSFTPIYNLQKSKK